AGAAATSNGVAGIVYGIPVGGTFPHYFVMVHDSEESAIRNYMMMYREASVILVDTYDVMACVLRSFRIARELGIKKFGFRIDSGALGAWAAEIGQACLEEGFQDNEITPSNDLNSTKMTALRREVRDWREDRGFPGARVDKFLVGTNAVTGNSSGPLGLFYKA